MNRMTKYKVKIKNSKCSVKWFRVVLLTAIIVSVALTLFKYEIQSHYSDYLLNSLKGPIPYDDPNLIQYIKEKILEPPSRKPYDLFQHAKLYKAQSESFYEMFTQMLFESKRNGFFVEVGALDGQTMSNTLMLEMNQGWTGLLVEPDPTNYIALKKKCRKAWTAKACLSVESYPKTEALSSNDIISNNHEFSDIKYRSMGSIVRASDNKTFVNKAVTKDETQNSYYIRQCFPLGSLLLALNVTQVDLLSLDVEFVEEEVIRHFDFERFNVQVLYMEWWEHNKLEWLFDFMNDRGYIFVANAPGDIIFAKNNTDISRLVLKLFPSRKFFLFRHREDSNTTTVTHQ